MKGTALLLAIMMVATPLAAQEITAGAAANPPTEVEAGTPPAPESSDVEVPEGLAATLRLLRTPGFHPELLETLGLDQVGSLSLLQEPEERSQEEGGGLPGWAKALIWGGVGVGAVFLFLFIAIDD